MSAHADECLPAQTRPALNCLTIFHDDIPNDYMGDLSEVTVNVSLTSAQYRPERQMDDLRNITILSHNNKKRKPYFLFPR